MITAYDYGIIAFYLLFMLAIGLVFRRMSKNTSDYFRAGGAMPWWLTGISAWIFSFSAWTFTGAAGKVYEAGTLVLVVFYASLFALAFALAFTGVRFRRMRVITWMEAVRQRYGAATEQFYTWVLLLLRLFFAGVSLNAIGVFMSAVFHIDMNTQLIVLGFVVTVVAFAGGSWAVLASDFVQAFLIVTITLCTAVLVLVRPEIGGLGGLLDKVPTAHLNWNELARPELIVLWTFGTLWLKFSDENNLERSTMYLMTRCDRDARLMVLIPLVGTMLGPLVWFIPSMAATIMHPNLAAEFPGLRQPHEAAFVAVALDVMPQGLIGLLLSAMLGATVTAMDAGLNKNVGIAIRSFYKPVLRPAASEQHLLVAGKVCTLIFGVVIVLFALLVNHFRDTNLFDFVNQLAANLLIPMALPLILGLFYKRTPGWSAWSTALVEGPDGKQWYLVYHAYEKDYYNLGRQTLLEPVEWTADGWVKATGTDVARSIPMPAGGAALPHGYALSDDFSANRIGTQWTFFHPRGALAEQYRYDHGALVLRASGTSPKDASPLQMITGDQAYEIEVEVERDEAATGGLMLFYSERLFAGLGFSEKSMIEYWKGDVTTFDKPAAIGRRFFLRLRNSHHYVSVWYSADGQQWTKHWMNFEVSGYHHNVAGGFLSLRPSLLATGKGEVRFRNFKYRALP